MRQVALAGTRPNQQQADLSPESGLRSKGLSAEIVAKKIGKSKNDVNAIRAIQKPDKAVPEVAKLVRDGKLNHRRAYDFVQGVPKDKQAEIVAADRTKLRPKKRGYGPEPATVPRRGVLMPRSS